MSLNNAQYDAIMREYNQKQARNQQFITRRQRELYTRIPELKSIDEEVAASSRQTASRILQGEQNARDLQKEHLAQLHARRLTLMEQNGYPQDYLTPQYDCADCQDTGFINGKKCHCFVQASIDLMYGQSHLKDILKRENFDTFSFEYYSAQIQDPASGITSLEAAHRAYEDATQYVDRFADERGNILLYGDTGVGKTFLTNCIAKGLMERGFSVIYFTAFQLFDIFEKNVFHKDKSVNKEIEQIEQCDVLIIDDLGTEYSNSFTNSQLFLCLNERLLHGKSTIISTNLSMKQIAETYTERTFSRISSNFKLIKLFGDDIRIRKKVKSH